MKRVRIPIEEFIRLHAEHEAGLGLKEICRKYNFVYTTLYFGFKRLGLTIHKATNEQRKRNPLQEDWFSKIDCQEKAYYLGLLMADGYVNHRKNMGNRSARMCLKLHKNDSYLVQQLVDFIQPGANLYIDKDSVACQINSNQLVEDLERLGLVERKTINGETLPELEEPFMAHFIRGYFDGDGSIHVRPDIRNRSTIYICGANYSFISKLQLYLRSVSIKTTSHIETRDHMGYRDMFTLHINDRVRFYKYIYRNASIFMIRKKLKYDHVNTVLTRKNWQRRA